MPMKSTYLDNKQSNLKSLTDDDFQLQRGFEQKKNFTPIFGTQNSFGLEN